MNEPAQLRVESSKGIQEGTYGGVVAGTHSDQSLTNISISELFSKLIPAFPIKTHHSALLNELLISSFAFINLVLAYFLISIEYFAPVRQELKLSLGIAAAILSFPLAYLSCRRIAFNAWGRLRQYELSIDLCYTLAVVIGLVNIAYLLLFNRHALALQAIDRSIIPVIFLITLMRYGEAYLFEKIERKVGFDLRDKAPRVRILRMQEIATNNNNGDGQDQLKEEYININEIRLGDLIRCKETEIFPADGLVVGGVSRVYERRLSGLEELRSKQVGDHVFAGSWVGVGAIDFRVTALPDESFISTFAQIINSRILKDCEGQLEKLNYKQTLLNLLFVLIAFAAGSVWAAKVGSFEVVSGIVISLLLISVIPKYLQLSWFIKPFAETLAFYRGALGSKSYLVDQLRDQHVLVLDIDSNQSSFGIENIKKFELIDKRVDEQSLLSVLFALASRGLEREALVVLRYVSSRPVNLSLQVVEEFEEIPQRGFYGKVGGFEFSVGNEDFLLDRGVMVQASEVNPLLGENCLYVALADEVIASFIISPAVDGDAVEFVSRLKNYNVRTVIISKDVAAKIDDIGKRMGLELPDVYGGMSDENIRRKLDSLKPLSLMTFNNLPSIYNDENTLSLSHFDELRWDHAQSDAVLFSRALTSISDLFMIARRAVSVYHQNFLGAVALTGILLPLAALGFITPVVCMTAILCASWAMLINVLRISRWS